LEHKQKERYVSEKEIKINPFMKWPGGKRRVLPEIRKYIPESYGTYYEGFLGGGAVLLDLLPEKAVVSDVNVELIEGYQTVRDEKDTLIALLEDHASKNSLDYFLEVRAWDRAEDWLTSSTQVKRTARMIYLNRTCFNGLYRVNSKNQFNAHFGHYKDPKVVDYENLEALSTWLKSADISFNHNGYKENISKAGAGDFAYLDPPYIPVTDTAYFVSYTKNGFDMDDQIELRDTAADIDARGGYVLLSNSDTPQIRELYKDFHIETIRVTRAIGAGAKSRVAVGEVLVLSKHLAEEKRLI
jgi:DNA adenine methylase